MFSGDRNFPPIDQLLLLYTRLKGFSRYEEVAKDRNIRGTSSIDCRERGSAARGVYPTEYTSRM